MGIGDYSSLTYRPTATRGLSPAVPSFPTASGDGPTATLPITHPSSNTFNQIYNPVSPVTFSGAVAQKSTDSDASVWLANAARAGTMQVGEHDTIWDGIFTRISNGWRHLVRCFTPDSCQNKIPLTVTEKTPLVERPLNILKEDVAAKAKTFADTAISYRKWSGVGDETVALTWADLKPSHLRDTLGKMYGAAKRNLQNPFKVANGEITVDAETFRGNLKERLGTIAEKSGKPLERLTSVGGFLEHTVWKANVDIFAEFGSGLAKGCVKGLWKPFLRLASNAFGEFMMLCGVVSDTKTAYQNAAKHDDGSFFSKVAVAGKTGFGAITSAIRRLACWETWVGGYILGASVLCPIGVVPSVIAGIIGGACVATATEKIFGFMPGFAKPKLE